MRDLWIFGYGSLVWRPAFAHAERQPAWVQGWARRFWQGSTDHRGVPGAPGRVVTLVEDPAARCDGTAYRVEAPQVPEVLEQLDHREQGGYERHELDLHLAHGGRERGLVYVATSRNANYLGPADTGAIAAQILESSGPSGHNAEYVLRLAVALREMDAHDPHVFELERLVARGGR